MKYVLAIFSVLILTVYLLWDYDIVANGDYEVNYLGDAIEIFIPRHPHASIPMDVVSYSRDGDTLIAISTDPTKPRKFRKPFRKGTCSIHFVNLKTGKNSIFQSKAEFVKHYKGSKNHVDETLSEFDRFQC